MRSGSPVASIGIGPALLGTILGALLPACASELPPASVTATPTSPPARAGSAALEMVAGVRADDPNAAKVARAILATRDEAARKALAPRVVAVARHVGTAAWRDAHRGELAAANASHGVEPTQRQFDAQLRQYQYEELVRAAGLLREVGGPEVIGYAFELAEDERAPRDWRALGVALLREVVSPNDAARSARVAQAAAHLPPQAPAQDGDVSNAGQVIAGLQPALRRCYEQDTATQGSGRVTLHVDASGAVASLSTSGNLPPSLAACVEAVLRGARFAPPEGGKATIVVPLMFVPKS